MPPIPSTPTGTSRRRFLQGSLLAAAAGVGLGAYPARRRQQLLPEEQRLKILILGGTRFLGPHVVENAIERGHTVTLFNRGKSNPDLFPDLELLKGDRDPDKGTGLESLRNRSWDAAVDTSGYYPRMVRASAGLLSANIGQYVFISSISVYADTSKPNQDETGEIATIEDETVETMGERFENYGPLKALCEQAATKAMVGRATNIRPGLIVGPRDNAPRFTYWPVRIERGGEVLAPGDPSDPVQFIDTRDLAAFIVGVIETRRMGVFNATGPNHPTTIGEMLHGCKAVTGGDARFTWVPADFLAEHDVYGWGDLPVWLPPVGETAGFHRFNIDRAIKAGLTSRPLADTVQATLDWYHAWPAGKPFPWRGGMQPEREREVLDAWHEAQKP
jgi:2'-hydroxyisoflavone reductase